MLLPFLFGHDAEAKGCWSSRYVCSPRRVFGLVQDCFCFANWSLRTRSNEEDDNMNRPCGMKKEALQCTVDSFFR